MSKAPLPYDYYNPSTWIVTDEDNENTSVKKNDERLRREKAEYEARELAKTKALALVADAERQAKAEQAEHDAYVLGFESAQARTEYEDVERTLKDQEQSAALTNDAFARFEKNIAAANDRDAAFYHNNNGDEDKDEDTGSYNNDKSNKQRQSAANIEHNQQKVIEIVRERESADERRSSLEEAPNTPPRKKPSAGDSSFSSFSPQATYLLSASPVYVAPLPTTTESATHEIRSFRTLPFRNATLKMFDDENEDDIDDWISSDGDGGSDHGHGHGHEQERDRSDDDDTGTNSFLRPPRQHHIRRGSPEREDIGIAMRQLTLQEQQDLQDERDERRERRRVKKAYKDAAAHHAEYFTLESMEWEREGMKLSMSHGRTKHKDADGNIVPFLKPHEIPMPSLCTNIGSLGKDGCAAVWWEYDRDSVPFEAWPNSWEIRRYRLDRDNVWRFKGTTVVNLPHLLEQNRTTVKDLENDKQYTFSVTATNSRGQGFESAQSAAVMVEAPLPPGWFRFYDDNLSKFFYSNIKTRASSWTRPELDPYYLDESIVLMFNAAEMATLKELYDEEISHFGRVSTEGFRRLMLEVGEVIGMDKAISLFRSYAGADIIKTWTEFMYIVSAVKKKIQNRDSSSNCMTLLNLTCGCPCFFYNEVISSQLNMWKLYALIGSEDEHEKHKIGKWTVEWSPLAERNLYTNLRTGETQWDTPEEVRFYMPTKMEEQLLQYFNEGDLQDFRVRFAHLDVNNSGAIDEIEFKLLLESMKIHLSDKHRRKLIKEIDLNGNGQIEYHEFCYMMLSLQKAKSGMNNIWDQIKLLTEDKEELQKVTEDILVVTTFEADHGVHDASHNPHAAVRKSRFDRLEEKNDAIEEEERLFELSRKLETLGHPPGTLPPTQAGEEGQSPKMIPVHGHSAKELYEIREKEIAAQKYKEENQSFQDMVKSEEEMEKSPADVTVKKQAFQNHILDKRIEEAEIEAKRKEDLKKEFNATTAGGEKKPKVRVSEQGLEAKDRAYLKFEKKRKIKAGEISAGPGRSGNFTAFDRFQHILRPKNPDEIAEEERKKKKERKPFTGESYVDRITRRRQEQADAEAAARGPDICSIIGNVIYGSSIGLLLQVGRCVFQTQQFANDFIDQSDKCFDLILCKRKPGPHGSHCMCGCRMILEEDVTYPSWFTESKAEPLTWAMVCPCVPCCWE